MRTCAVCPVKHYCRGFCQEHYVRWKRHGDPLAGKTPEGEPLRFLLTAVGAPCGDENPCVRWPYGVVGRPDRPYGHVVYRGTKHLVHRLALELRFGPPPADKPMALHGECNDSLCLVHLRWGTHAENMADRERDRVKGRRQR